jgi:CHRD domain
MSRSSFAMAFAVTGLLSFAAHAEKIPMHAMLDTASEVPPTTGTGKGTLDGSLDTASKMLTYTLTFSGLSGPATAAHFHGPAAVGANAGVAVPIKGTASPDKGSVKLTDAQIADLEAGKWYVNVHTKANPGGEIRGQVMKGM